MPKYVNIKNDYYTATLYIVLTGTEKVLLSRENTLSEAAEESCTSSAFLAASAQCGSVSLAFHHSNVCNVHTISSVGSSVFRPAIILELTRTSLVSRLPGKMKTCWIHPCYKHKESSANVPHIGKDEFLTKVGQLA